MMASFMEELDKYLNTPEMKKALKEHIASGKGGGTGSAEDEAAVMKYVEEVKKAIIDSLPYSLRNSGTHSIITEDLIVAAPIHINQQGNYELQLGWRPDAVHRNSLYEDGYPEGIKDITALFRSGYGPTRNYVYGWWDGHKDSPDGYSDLRNAAVFSDYVWIRSLRERPASDYLDKAIETFNATHAKDGVVVTIVEAYYKSLK